MNITEYIKKLDEKIASEKYLKPFELAVRSAHAEMTTRIFSKGLNSAGGKMGTYDATKEIWIPDSALPKKGSHLGKPNKDGKRKKIKTTYYKSYREMRQQQGREAGFVNIRLTNDLQSDFANAEISKTSTAIAPAKPVKVSPTIYRITLKRDLNVKKKEGMEEKYGPIFRLTVDEKAKFYTVLRKELNVRASR